MLDTTQCLKCFVFLCTVKKNDCNWYFVFSYLCSVFSCCYCWWYSLHPACDRSDYHHHCDLLQPEEKSSEERGRRMSTAGRLKFPPCSWVLGRMVGGAELWGIQPSNVIHWNDPTWSFCETALHCETFKWLFFQAADNMQFEFILKLLHYNFTITISMDLFLWWAVQLKYMFLNNFRNSWDVGFLLGSVKVNLKLYSKWMHYKYFISAV